MFPGPQPEFEEAWYPLSAAQLARLARAPPATVSLIREDGQASAYAGWSVEPRALELFLEATGFARRSP